MRVAKVSHLVTRWRQLQKKPKAPNQNRTRRDSQIYEHNVFSSYWLFTKFHQWILSKIDMPESAGEVGPLKDALCGAHWYPNLVALVAEAMI